MKKKKWTEYNKIDMYMHQTIYNECKNGIVHKKR